MNNLGEITVRTEEPRDYAVVKEILLEAFQDHPYSRQTEHLIVEALREAHALTVALVAEIGGVVVGHIAFSPITIDGAKCDWFALGPVAVAKIHRRHGVGGKLIEAGLEQLKGLGAKGCLLVGDPEFYTRFGFRNDPSLFLEGVPSQYVMALPLSDSTPQGKVEHHSAFHVS